MYTKGAEWVNEYYGRTTDLSYCDNDALGFYNKLNGTKKFAFGDKSAWDQDFEDEGVGKLPAGTANKFVDTVDIMYFAGHGYPEGLVFGRTAYDNGIASPSEMRLGKIRLKWLVLSACRVLERSPKMFEILQPVFNGLHYILGFETNCSDVKSRGETFASYLNWGISIRQAWISACVETESSSYRCAYMRVDTKEPTTYYDQWIGYRAPTPKKYDSICHFSQNC